MLVDALLDEFPFEENERAWVQPRIAEDFSLPGRRDLLYLVLCTLTKNALIALRGTDKPSLRIEVGVEHTRAARPFVRFVDNGPGISPDVLSRLTREPVTTRAETGGNGMGLMFCQRVVQAVGGEIAIASQLGEGTSVSLYFNPT
jgi:two-component system response regulator PhcR